MKKLFLFTLVLFSVAVNAQTRQSLLKSALVNSTAGDTFLLRDSVLAHIYYDAESDSMLLAGLKYDGLSQADADYMRAQLMNYRPHTWTKDSITGAVIVPSSAVPSAALEPKKSAKAWSKYFETHNKGYYEVSEPVFSRDGMYAVVYVAFECGANCGNGGATLYHFENGEWKPVSNLFSYNKQGK
ncbi:MAG TPA: hypothetical protein VFU15_13495 [Bacteroidia bacterium]|nr:hypothetical protein [Bacteroidia bacterium]